ncbi:MAG TPA: hypothetical protein VHW47_02940 [Acidimicrobiales bacterium]|jgi:hypothetical protein|nr:hypothetical protein [Acidimicrobiales bacterium]
MTERLYLSRREAAAACGKSEDTIRRYDRSGRFPGRHVTAGGVTVYPLADLVAAGLLDPAALFDPSVTSEPAAGRVGGTSSDGELAAAHADLAVARARIADLTAWIDRQHGEIEFLRGLVQRSVVV